MMIRSNLGSVVHQPSGRRHGEKLFDKVPSIRKFQNTSTDADDWSETAVLALQIEPNVCANPVSTSIKDRILLGKVVQVRELTQRLSDRRKQRAKKEQQQPHTSLGDKTVQRAHFTVAARGEESEAAKVVQEMKQRIKESPSFESSNTETTGENTPPTGAVGHRAEKHPRKLRFKKEKQQEEREAAKVVQEEKQRIQDSPSFESSKAASSRENTQPPPEEVGHPAEKHHIPTMVKHMILREGLEQPPKIMMHSDLTEQIEQVRREKSRQEDDFVAILHDLEMLAQMEDDDSPEQVTLLNQISSIRAEAKAAQEQLGAMIQDLEGRAEKRSAAPYQYDKSLSVTISASRDIHSMYSPGVTDFSCEEEKEEAFSGTDDDGIEIVLHAKRTNVPEVVTPDTNKGVQSPEKEQVKADGTIETEQELQRKLHQLYDEKEELFKSYFVCEQKVVQLKGSLSDKGKELSDALLQLASSQAEVRQAREEYKRSVAKSETLEGTMNDLTAVIEKLKVEKATLSQGLSQEVLRQIEDRDQKARAKNKQLEDELMACGVSVERIELLESEKSKLEQDFSACTQKITELEHELSKQEEVYSGMIQDQGLQILKHLEEKSAMAEKLDVLKQSMEKMRAGAEEVEREKEQLRAEVSAYFKKVEELEEAAGKAQDERFEQALLGKEKAWQREQQESKDALNKATQDLSLLEQALDASRSAVSRLKLEKEGLAQTLAARGETDTNLKASFAAQSETFRKAIDKKNTEIEHLSKECRIQQERIEVLSASADQVGQLQTSTAQLQADKAGLEQKITELGEQVDLLKKIESDQETRVATTNRDLEIHQQTSEETRKAADAKVSEMEHAVELLNKTIESLSADLALIRDQKDQEMKAAEGKIAELEGAMSWYQEEMKRLHSEIDFIGKSGETLESEKQSAQLKLSSLEDELKKSFRTIESLQAEKNDQLKWIERLTRMNEKEQSSADAKISELEDAIETLKDTVIQLNTEKECLSADIQQLGFQHALDQQSRQLEIAELEDAANKERNRGNDHLGASETRFKDLGNAVDVLRQTVLKLETERDRLAKEMDEISLLRAKDQQIAEMDIMELEAELKKTRDVVQKLQTDNVTLSQANLKNYDKIAELETRLKDSSQREQTLRVDDDAQLQRQVAELRNLYERAEAENEDLVRKNAIIFEQVAQLEAQNNEQLAFFMETQQELDVRTRERDAQIRTVNEVSDQVMSLHAEIEQLRQRKKPPGEH